jgi:uncharacterized membrane protein
MANLNLSPIGLSIAAVMSVANVFTDVARKKALAGRSLIPATFWCKAFTAVVFGAMLLLRIAQGSPLVIRDGGNLFGLARIHLSPVPTFGIYLLIDILLVSVANLLYFLALQVSPMSLCVPFLAFTPIFLIPTGFVMLGELPAPLKLAGVALIVVGSLVMHRRLFAVGWMAPVQAIVKEPGSRYMLMVACIFSVTNPLEKKLVLMSDIYIQAFAFGLGLCIFLFILAMVKKEDFVAAVRKNLPWVVTAGVGDGVALLLQLAAYRYIDVVITVSIKRAGIVLSVFSGWLFFRERGITDKVIAASVMFAGVLILYLPLTAMQVGVMTILTLIAMSFALRFTRGQPVR